MQVYTGHPSVILCSDTKSFRKLCRTQVSEGDSVIDIGASYGASTQASSSSPAWHCLASMHEPEPPLPALRVWQRH